MSQNQGFHFYIKNTYQNWVSVVSKNPMRNSICCTRET